MDGTGRTCGAGDGHVIATAVQPASGRAGSGRTGPVRIGQDRTGPDWTRPNCTGPDTAGPDRTKPEQAVGQDRTGPDRAVGRGVVRAISRCRHGNERRNWHDGHRERERERERRHNETTADRGRETRAQLLLPRTASFVTRVTTAAISTYTSSVRQVTWRCFEVQYSEVGALSRPLRVTR